MNNTEDYTGNIQHLIYTIAKERKRRLLSFGAVEWTYNEKITFTNSSNGFYVNEDKILDSSYFKSEYISNLLDDEYTNKLIQKIATSI